MRRRARRPDRWHAAVALAVAAMAGTALYCSGCTPASHRSQVSGPRFLETGDASWYGSEFSGRPTASGAIFNPYDMTAAHPTLPLGSRVRVMNTATGESVIVTINDRFPAPPGRVIDLSEGAFARIAPTDQGVVPVLVEPLP